MQVKRVLLLSKYSRVGASSRLRTLQYLDWLASQNINVTVSSFFDDIYLHKIYSDVKVSKLSLLYYYLKRLFCLFTVNRFDVIWLEAEIFMFFPAFFEKLLNIFGVRYIVDYDDAIFHNYDMSKSKIIRFLLSKKIDVVMKNAHTVVAGNSYLANRAIEAGAKNVVVIPTVVNSSRYVNNFNKDKKKLVVGWIGSPSTQKYVVQIRDALSLLNKKFDFSLHLVGSTTSVLNDLNEFDVEIVKWSEITEIESINQMDIGIMPLIDGPWERGKCGYKLIQYMACGIPVIASPVGVNTSIIHNNNCGLLASSIVDWSNSLIELAESKTKREYFGQNGRKAVANIYSTNVQQELLLNVFKSVFENK